MPAQFSAPPILLSVPEACSAARIGTTMLYSLLSSGAIRSVKVGRRRLIERDSIKRWQASLIANEGLKTTEASK